MTYQEQMAAALERSRRHLWRKAMEREAESLRNWGKILDRLDNATTPVTVRIAPIYGIATSEGEKRDLRNAP